MLYFAVKLLALITNTKYSAPPSPKYSTQNLGDILLGKPVKFFPAHSLPKGSARDFPKGQSNPYHLN